MSSSKKTAFARTPRGTSTGTPTGDAIQINKQFLDKFTQAKLGPDMATVLTKSSAELNITIQPNGKGNFTINSATHGVIGDSADVQKIQVLGSFINDERKALLKASVSSGAKRSIAAIVSLSNDKNMAMHIDRPITKLDKGFVDVYRMAQIQAEMLEGNLEAISGCRATGPANEMVKNHLLETGLRIQDAIGQYLFYRGGLTSEETPQKLDSFLRNGRIMSWVFTRLCTQKLNLGGQDFEFRKVYFPKDPTKGLSITFSELQTDDLCNNQGGVLTGCEPFIGLWKDATMTLCGIPNWNLHDFSPSAPARILANVPLMVVPFPGAVTVEEKLLILAKDGERGLPWSVGNTISPQEVLRFLGTVPKRIAYGFMGRSRFAASILQTVFTGFVADNSVVEKDTRSVFSQLATQVKAGTANSKFLDTVVSEGELTAEQRVTLSEIVALVLEVPIGSYFLTTLNAAIRQGHRKILVGETSSTSNLWGLVKTRRSVLSDEQVNAVLSDVLDASLIPKTKTPKGDGVRMARSSLSPAGSELIARMKTAKYSALAARMDVWLRSFLTTKLQGAVAEIVMARLEASLANPVVFNAKDHTAIVEVAEFTDWASDEPQGETAEEENPDAEK